MTPKKKCIVLAVATALLGSTAQAQTTVGFAGGRLALTTPNADQSVKVEVGPASGVARLYGFAGISDGTQYTGVTGVTVMTGAGNDFVEFDIQTSQSLDIRVDTGTGNAERKVQWRLLPAAAGVAANLHLSSAPTGTQIASVDIQSTANNATIAINAGASSEAAIKVESTDASAFLGVLYRSAAPKSTLEITSNASALEVDAGGGNLLALNTLTYKIAQLRPANVLVKWDVLTGSAEDVVEGIIAASGSTITQIGNVATQGGNDAVLLESEGFSTSTGIAIAGGAGNDNLAQLVKGRFQMSQTLQTFMTGGAGDDLVQLRTDTGIWGTGLPNDQNPLINCGAGNDLFWAFGIILGCEARM